MRCYFKLVTFDDDLKEVIRYFSISEELGANFILDTLYSFTKIKSNTWTDDTWFEKDEYELTKVKDFYPYFVDSTDDKLKKDFCNLIPLSPNLYDFVDECYDCCSANSIKFVIDNDKYKDLSDIITPSFNKSGWDIFHIHLKTFLEDTKGMKFSDAFLKLLRAVPIDKKEFEKKQKRYYCSTIFIFSECMDDFDCEEYIKNYKD